MITLNSIKEINTFTQENPMAVVVFSTRSCSVCKPLKVKLNKALENYTLPVMGQVYIEDVAEASGYYQVFTAPITLVFVDGQETKRYSAAMNLLEFEKTIERFEGLLS